MQGWFGVKPAAAYVDRSPRTVRKWLGMGLKHSRVGGSILIKVSDLDEFLEKFSETSNQVDEMVDRVVREVLRG